MQGDNSTPMSDVTSTAVLEDIQEVDEEEEGQKDWWREMNEKRNLR